MPRVADPALPERRRAQILEAAWSCFRDRGFRQTTIEEICAEARISPGALYRYFGSKADIVAAIALDARAEAEAAHAELAGAEALIDGLAGMARTFLMAFTDAGKGALLADIWAEAAREPLLAKALAERDRIARGKLAAAIDRTRREGEIHPAMDSQAAAEILFSALEGFALRRAVWQSADVAQAVSKYRLLALHILKPKR